MPCAWRPATAGTAFPAKSGAPPIEHFYATTPLAAEPYPPRHAPGPRDAGSTVRAFAGAARLAQPCQFTFLSSGEGDGQPSRLEQQLQEILAVHDGQNATRAELVVPHPSSVKPDPVPLFCAIAGFGVSPGPASPGNCKTIANC